MHNYAMYIIAIGWLYVTALVALNEASVVAGIASFLLYGLLPCGLLLWLGGLDDENATLSQRIVIPDRATTLSYYYWIESYETADNCSFDTATVRLGGNTLQTYDLCATTNTGGWKPAQFNISAYRGQSLDLVFQVVTDSVDTSSLYVDTVTIATE